MTICMGPEGDTKQASPASLVLQLLLLRKLRRLQFHALFTPYSCCLDSGHSLALGGGRLGGQSSPRTPAGPKHSINTYNGSNQNTPIMEDLVSLAFLYAHYRDRPACGSAIEPRNGPPYTRQSRTTPMQTCTWSEPLTTDYRAAPTFL